MQAIVLPPEDQIFAELRQQNELLKEHRLRLQIACRQLASLNGSGDGIRRRIFASLQRWVEVRRGPGK